ncbi:protein of unknown function [Xylanibacter ruminicola]|uniref:DUF4369 domain-containing protein n=1 Tax=Xylanibacter ruminicola TaxID=839 RepID=A0A1H5X4P0_XYLRU|nr:DUF4369 domain-containing protein [Xylanibacter ruminicola]SEG06543.1 protein of unknown function [Xylanibacter ruminicola]
MELKSIVGLAVAGFVLASCQPNSYQINGYARQLHEGDTIILALDDQPEHVLASTTVSEGKFWFERQLDNSAPCRVYAKQQPECSAFFFPDQGTVTIDLNLPPTPSVVSGTKLNNQWQQLNDSIQRLGTRLISIAEKQDVDSATHLSRLATIDSLHRAMSACIRNTAQANKDNPLGKYILENYKEPEFK